MNVDWTSHHLHFVNKFSAQLVHFFSFSHAAVNVQMKNGSKASNKIKSAQNKPKAGLANKSLTAGISVIQSRRNMVRSWSC